MSNIRFQGNPSGTGTLTIASPNTNSDFTLNLPTANGTIPLLATVTNNGVMFINGSGQPTTGTALTFDGSVLGLTTNQRFVASSSNISFWKDGTPTRAARLGYTVGSAPADSISLGVFNGTSWNDALIVDQSGNVGIGTSSPGAKLDVAGAISSVNGYQDNLVLQNALSGSRNRFILGQSLASGAYIYTDAPGGVASPLPMTFWTAGTERMRIDSSGNVGIGTSSPTSSLVVSGAATGSPTVNGVHLGIQSNYATIEMCSSVGSLIDFTTSGTDFRGRLLYDNAGNFMAFSTNGVERARFSATGQMSTTTGTGSVALAYDARAWVNFNGTGTVAIRASGNVSSITDNGTGDYTVNFSTAMPDANYSVAGNIADVVSGINCILKVVAPNVASAPTLKTASQVRIGTNSDSNETNVTIFR